jgi:MFS family permease
MTISGRGTILLTFAAFGAMIGTNVGAFPVIIKNSDLSLWLFGLIGTIGMLSNIVLMAMGGFINRYADHRTVLLWILPLSFTALVFAQFAFSPLTFVVSAILISMCFGAMDLFMNAEGAAIEQLHEKTIFSAYHGSASLMMAVFAIISSMVSVWLAPWFVCLFTFVPMALAFVAIYKNIPHRPLVHHSVDQKPYLIDYSHSWDLRQALVSPVKWHACNGRDSYSVLSPQVLPLIQD